MPRALDLVRTLFSRINLTCAIVGAGLLFGIAAISPVKEIAEKMGITTKAVERLIGRSLKALRKDLKEFITAIVLFCLPIL